MGISFFVVGCTISEYVSLHICRMNLQEFASDLVVKARLGTLGSNSFDDLVHVKFDDLQAQLPSDQQKMAFWINLYNAKLVQVIRNNNEIQNVYTTRMIDIAGLHMSLDDIEHGILRRSKLKATMGYVRKPRVASWEKALRVKRLDPRIHFALNCGANSCPPIFNYSSNTLDSTLDRATKNYLLESSVISSCHGEVHAPRLLLWYLGDFGGFAGIRALYQRHGIVPPDVFPKFKFLNYDWSRNLENFA